MKIYKIKNSEGLYSTGGSRPKWTKRGKTWSQMNFVKNHLRMFINESQYRNIYENKIPRDWILEVYDFDKSEKEELECYSLITPPEWYINKNNEFN